MRARHLGPAFGAGLLLALTLAPAHAQTEDHPIVGTWHLNLERSSFEPGPGPRALTRRFGVDEEGFLVSGRVTVSATGNPSFAMARAKFDGADYEVWTDGSVYGQLAQGGTPRGTASFRVVDDHTLELTQKNAEGEVGALSPNTWTVSPDGSTLTVTTTGTTADGVEVRNVEVYDRVEQN
jgi:hypothetical protein